MTERSPHMPLTDTAVKNAKPEAKPRKLSDERGLYLLITPTGSKYWRFKYRFVGREKMLALGVYPDVSLADARIRNSLLPDCPRWRHRLYRHR